LPGGSCGYVVCHRHGRLEDGIGVHAPNLGAFPSCRASCRIAARSSRMLADVSRPGMEQQALRCLRGQPSLHGRRLREESLGMDAAPLRRGASACAHGEHDVTITGRLP